MLIVAHAVCPQQGAIADLFGEITQRLTSRGHVQTLVSAPTTFGDSPSRSEQQFGPLGGLLSPRYLKHLIRLRRQRPDLFLSWSQHPAAALPLALLRAETNVAWWHEPTNRGQVGRIKQLAYDAYRVAVINRADIIGVASDAVARSVPARFAARVRVIEFPILTSLSSPSERFTAHPTDLVFFGILAPHKGLDILADALASLRREGIAPTLRIAGPGDLRHAAPSMEAFRLDHPEQVQRVDGFLEGPDLASAIVSASTVVLPYLSAAGTTTVGAAHALGRGVIASRVGAFADQIRDGIDGHLVEAGNASALADAIRTAIDERLDLPHDDVTERGEWASSFLRSVKT